MLRLTSVPSNLVPLLPSLHSLQTLREGEKIVCACLYVCLHTQRMSGGRSGGEQGRGELGKQEGAGGGAKGREKVTKESGKWGPFLSFFFRLCFSLPCCHCAAWIPPHPCLWCPSDSLHSHAPNLVHTMSTSHPHYLVQVVVMPLCTNP